MKVDRERVGRVGCLGFWTSQAGVSFVFKFQINNFLFTVKNSPAAPKTPLQVT